MTEDEFLTLTLPQRIAWLHSKDGPRGKKSHDWLAKIIGTSRQVVIDWEKEAGAEPSAKFRHALSEFSGFPAEAFSRREAEAISAASIASRLEGLEKRLDESIALTNETLRLLREAQRPAGEDRRAGRGRKAS